MPRRATSGGKADVTIKDLAAHLGVSHATVSRALSDHSATSAHTKARVHEAAAALGYVRNASAGALSGARSRLIGFIAPDLGDFYATVAKVLGAACNQAGMQLILAVSEDDPELERQHILGLREARAAGVVITPTAGLTAQSATLLKSMAAVQLIRSNASLDKPWVGLDDRVGVNLATRHLIELGHERIGFIGGYESLTTGHERRGGYADALAEAGQPYDEALVALGPPRASFGQEAALRLMRLERPITGLVLGSSQLTMGALKAIQQSRVHTPDQLSVVGYADPEWFRLWGPGLTTIDLPIEDLAAAVAQVLFRAIDAPERQQAVRGGITFRPQLIERGSAAPPLVV